MDRRTLLIAGAALPAMTQHAYSATDEAVKALQAGGCVVALRHALAPGTFDPPEFRIGDCSTQRNLDATGRSQSARIGAWFKERGLTPSAVRSSPWCRCQDTARLAFGRFDTWDMLGSPVGSPAAVNAGRVAAMQAALAAVPAGRFEVWVTHNFVLSAFTGDGASQGAGLVLRPGTGDRPQLVARLAIV
jgi:phosphohistidine phosphatase SixA